MEDSSPSAAPFGGFLGSFTAPLGAALLIAALATMGVGASEVADFWVGPIGNRLVSISAIVDLPVALCFVGAVLALLVDGRPKVRSLARWIGVSAGLVLVGLTVTGVAGVVALATPHGRAPILKALDASSDAVGYLTLLSTAAVLFVLAVAGDKEDA